MILAIPSFIDAQFEIKNQLNEPVSVVAQWQDEVKEIQNISPMSSFEFSLDAEAAMKFRVRYPGGREVESEPIYFSSGLKVIATITDNGVKVRYDHET